MNWIDFDYHELVSFRREDIEIIQMDFTRQFSKLLRYQNRVKKGWFFLVREGPRKLVAKYVSYRFSKKLAKSRFVIVKIKRGERYYGGLQKSLNQPIFYFHKSSCKNSKPSLDEYSEIIDYDPFVGYELRYQTEDVRNTCEAKKPTFIPICIKTSKKVTKSDLDLYAIGCGDYVRTTVLPFFREFNFKIAVDFNFEVLKSKYLENFEIKTIDFEQMLELHEKGNLKVGVIASYHSYHTQQAIKFLRLEESKVIVEKPPCVTRNDLKELVRSFDPYRMFIGYNRRFLKWNEVVRDLIGKYQAPIQMTISVNETQITANHWYFAPNQGGRICGNLCHWVDLAIFLIQKKPVVVKAIRNDVLGSDYSVFGLLFEDGSLVSIGASDWGDGTKGVQERIVVRSEDLEIVIDDYTKMKVWERGRTRIYCALRRRKGHEEMYREFRDSIIQGGSSNYSLMDLIYGTLSYLGMVELIDSGKDSMRLDYDGFHI